MSSPPDLPFPYELRAAGRGNAVPASRFLSFVNSEFVAALQQLQDELGIPMDEGGKGGQAPPSKTPPSSDDRPGMSARETLRRLRGSAAS
jgi:hypothetical protein